MELAPSAFALPRFAAARPANRAYGISSLTPSVSQAEPVHPATASAASSVGSSGLASAIAAGASVALAAAAERRWHRGSTSRRTGGLRPARQRSALRAVSVGAGATTAAATSSASAAVIADPAVLDANSPSSSTGAEGLGEVSSSAPWSRRTRYVQAPVRIPETSACPDGAVCLPEGRLNNAAPQPAAPDEQITKMICTLGPASSSVEVLEELIEAGMSVARLNFSHGDHESQLQLLRSVREAAARCSSGSNPKPVGIMLDTKGPEIRTGNTKNNEKVSYKRGDTITLTSDYDLHCDSHTIPLSYAKIIEMLQVGQPVRIGDGALNVEVTDISSAANGRVQAVVLNDVEIGGRKNCNVPGVFVDLPLLQPKDKVDLLDFALPNGVDFVALSFVQDAASVREVRDLLRAHCPEGRSPPQLIAKIENGEGLRNFDEILEASDGIMVARGDLGMEIPPEQVFMAQKVMIGRCNLAGKFVITATQMLESMTKSPRPTRAEASDVANAVLDGSDCVMLSGETAAGLFPIEAATIMSRICREAERSMDHSASSHSISAALDGTKRNQHQGVCHAAVRLALDTGCQAILGLTRSGYTARELAKYKPPMPIVAVAPDAETCRSLALVRGVAAIEVPAMRTATAATKQLITAALEEAQDAGLIIAGDSVVVVHGAPDGDTNLVEVVAVW